MKLAKQAIEQEDMETEKVPTLSKLKTLYRSSISPLIGKSNWPLRWGRCMYIHRRLIEANINNDKDIVAEVEGYVKDLRDAWKQALQIERAGPVRIGDSDNGKD